MLNTGIAIPHAYWSKRFCKVADNLPPEHGQAQALNARLVDLRRLVEDLVTWANKQGHPNVLEFLKSTFRQDLTFDAFLEVEAAKQ